MRRLLALACAIVLVDTIFYAALVPLVPYFDAEFGLSKSIVGILSGAYGAGVLVGSAPGGYLASRVGVKVTAILGLLLMSLMSIAFGFADSVGVLVATRFLAGFGSALSWVAAFTWLTGRAPEERRGEMIGLMVSAAVVGALLGPILGSAAAIFGTVPAFAVVSAIGAGMAVWAALEPAPGPTREGRIFASLRPVLRPDIRVGLLLIALSPFLFSAINVLVPVELGRLGWGAAAVGAVFFVSAAFEAVVHPLLGRWSDRSGFRTPIGFGLLGSTVVLIALALSGNPWVLGLLVVLAAGTFYAPLVPGTSLFSGRAEKAGVERAMTFGVTNFAWAAGYAAGAPLVGFVADLRGDAVSCLLLAGLCVLSLLLLRGRL